MRGWFVGVCLVQLVGGCVGGPADEGPTSSTPTTQQAPVTPTGTSPATGAAVLSPFLSGLSAPVYLTHAGDGSGRMFIVEQTGKILVWKSGALLPTPFLDLTSIIAYGGERGLLGLVFHPEYETNGAFFVYYTRTGTPAEIGDIVIARYKVAAPTLDVADPSTAQTLLVIDHPVNSNHNGGQLEFGPDGFLYIGTGDGGAANDPPNNAQNTNSLLGKLLRIDAGPTGAYRVPDSNPMIGIGGAPEIWAYGLRNPWRFSFDRATGDLYIGDVGQDNWEEIDHQPPSSEGGENYGWRVYEGTHLYIPGVVLDHTLPVAEYDHNDGDCSISGGYVYRGTEVPALEGYYVVGDYCTGKTWTLAKVGSSWALAPFIDTDFAISSFGEDEGGELYLIDLGGTIQKFRSA